jgi:predicted transport protein
MEMSVVNQRKLVEINLFNANLSKFQNQLTLNVKNVNIIWKARRSVVDHTVQPVETKVLSVTLELTEHGLLLVLDVPTTVMNVVNLVLVRTNVLPVRMDVKCWHVTLSVVMNAIMTAKNVVRQWLRLASTKELSVTTGSIWMPLQHVVLTTVFTTLHHAAHLL